MTMNSGGDERQRDVEQPGDVALWLSGLVAVAVSIVGLTMAGRADDTMFGFAGLLLFLFGVITIFVLIAMATGKQR